MGVNLFLLKLLIHKSHGLRKKRSLTEKLKEEQRKNMNSSQRGRDSRRGERFVAGSEMVDRERDCRR
jgi:predicted RNA-binding protein